MKTLLTEQFAVKGLLSVLSLIILFHLLVVFGLIPFDIVWRGKLQSPQQMLKLELISIGVNLLMVAVVATRAGILKLPVHYRVISVLLWAMAGLFVFNTLGNILSENGFEKAVFTPLTLVLAVLSGRLAVGTKAKAGG